MDKPIQVGDLVWVAKPTRCGCWTNAGKVFTVAKLSSNKRGRCITCQQETYPPGTLTAYWAELDGWAEVTRLKRIPPPEELGIVDEREEITA